MVTSILSERVAVVTGATGAIGSALVTSLVARGVTVCAFGSSQEGLQRALEQREWPSARVELYAADFRSQSDIQRVCDVCVANHRQIHLLLHCAGTIELGSIQDASLDEFDRQIQVNVRAPFQVTQAFIASLQSSKGQIAFVNSTAGIHARGGAAQYAASKHALKAIADSLREELNSHGIRVMSLFLGRTASEMQRKVHDREGRPYDATKLIQPDDVASVLIHALEMAPTSEITDVWMRPALKSY